MSKVFLGGTCADTVWRERLIPMLNIDYFNPVVKDWTEECMAEEIRQRESCDYCLYVITPSMEGVYSIAEVTDDSNKRPEKTIFCVLQNEIPIGYENDDISFAFAIMKTPIYPRGKSSFNESEMKSLNQTGKLIQNNGGLYLKSLDEVAKYLNSRN